jgi:hypothetical protein
LRTTRYFQKRFIYATLSLYAASVTLSAAALAQGNLQSNQGATEFPKYCNGILNAAEHRTIIYAKSGAVHLYARNGGALSYLDFTRTKDGGRESFLRPAPRAAMEEICRGGTEIAVIEEDAPKQSVDELASHALALSNEFDTLRLDQLQSLERPKVNNTFYAVGAMPSNFIVSRTSGIVLGNLRVNGISPTNLNTQWISFNYATTGYANSTEHLIVVLFSNSALIRVGRLEGNGIIVGTNSGSFGVGCGNLYAPLPANSSPSYNAQYEAWWQTGNAVYPQGCGSNSVGDSSTHHFDLQANKFQDIWFHRQNLTNGIWTIAPAINSAAARNASGITWNPANGGVAIGSTNDFGGTNNFSIQFTSVVTGWF